MNINNSRSTPSISEGNPFDVIVNTNINSNSKKINSINVTQRQMLDQQNLIMQQQDLMLDDVSNGLKVTKEVANVMNDEINLHIRLIDEIGENVDISNKNLLQETQHTVDVNRASNTRPLWCVIILLIVLFILLLALK